MTMYQLQGVGLLFAILIPWAGAAATAMWFTFGIYVPKKDNDEEAVWWCTPLVVLMSILEIAVACAGIGGTIWLINHLAGF